MIVKLHTACSSCNGIIIKVALEAFKLSIKKISELYKPLLSFTISQHHGACYEILGATDALSASNLQRKFSIKVSMVTKRRGSHGVASLDTGMPGFDTHFVSK